MPWRTLPEQHVPSPEQRWVLLETLQALDELLDGLQPAGASGPFSGASSKAWATPK